MCPLGFVFFGLAFPDWVDFSLKPCAHAVCWLFTRWVDLALPPSSYVNTLSGWRSQWVPVICPCADSFHQTNSSKSWANWFLGKCLESRWGNVAPTVPTTRWMVESVGMSSQLSYDQLAMPIHLGEVEDMPQFPIYWAHSHEMVQ